MSEQNLAELKKLAIRFIKTKSKQSREIWGSERQIYTTLIKEFLEWVKEESCKNKI